jgi:hypothetical protein
VTGGIAIISSIIRGRLKWNLYVFQFTRIKLKW